jgi:hypothetical protein
MVQIIIHITLPVLSGTEYLLVISWNITILEMWNQKLVTNSKFYMTNFMNVESVLVEIIIVKKKLLLLLV